MRRDCQLAAVFLSATLALSCQPAGDINETTPPGNNTEAILTCLADTFCFVPVSGAVCLDGSGTGFEIMFRSGASDLLIFMEGGGACWDGDTCRPDGSIPGQPPAGPYGTVQRVK